MISRSIINSGILLPEFSPGKVLEMLSFREIV